MSATFVLLHGAWHGGWCWRPVAERLRAAGHRVFTPTQTGLGDRRHLLTRDVTLDTFADDLVQVIEAEELMEVVLVGHSFGGAAITAAADRMPQRIRHLVYLDALVLEAGTSPFGVLPAELVADRRRAAEEHDAGLSIPPPPVTAFGIPADHALADWVARRLTPHPIATFESPLTLAHPIGNGRPCTYVACTAPAYAPLAASRAWVRRQTGWHWREIAAGHEAMVTAPEALATLLGEMATGATP